MNHEYRSRFTIAHELGHYVMHADYIKTLNITSQNSFEVILKTFGPSAFVTYFFILGYLRNLKISIAPSIRSDRLT